MPLNPPSAIDRRGLTPLVSSDGSYASIYPNGGKPDPLSFTPLVADNLSGLTAGDSYPNWVGINSVDTTRAKVGSKSIKVTLQQGQPPTTCGGSRSFGGRRSLPYQVSEGENAWYRAFFYLPSSMSAGFVYETNTDDAEAAECGFGSADGSGRTKWLVFSTAETSGRLYIQLENQRRSVASFSGMNIRSEVGGGLNRFQEAVIPTDQWFQLQVHVYAHSVSGFMRAWIDDAYIGQLDSPTLNSPTDKLTEWGLGNYFNGTPYTDGAPSTTADFWVDYPLVATDAAGYGAPSDVDSGGRTYIAPTTIGEAP